MEKITRKSALKKVGAFIGTSTLLGSSRPEIQAENTTPDDDSFYNIADYHIEKDGKTLVTAKIQSIIDECSKNGGGKIFFPSGTYLTGTLILKDNVFLEVSAGSTILGSSHMKDYDPPYTIYAHQAKNFGIIGQGTINGNGKSFWLNKQRPYNRPDRLIFFENCSDIRINDVKLINSPNWNIELRYCDYAWIDGVSIISPRKAPNTDGIDPTSSSNIFITNCYIDTGDDAICPKSNEGRPTENVIVENCILRSDDTGIKLGTASHAPIRNLVFNNIIIRDSTIGIGFYAKDGGIFENVRFSDITIEAPQEDNVEPDRPGFNWAIFLDIEKRKPSSGISQIRNIFFSDILINSQDANCLFFGQPYQKIENINLSNVHYNQYKHRTFKGTNKPRGVRNLKERAENDFSNIPSNFTFAYVKGLNINNLSLNDYDTTGKYERHMIWGYHIEDVLISGFKNRLNNPLTRKSQLVFQNSSKVKIQNCAPNKSTTPFLELKGEDTKDISIMFNDFSSIKESVNVGTEVEKNTVHLEFNG